MKPWSFYEHWLEQVSRSFALCIPQLDRPFRDQVALAYLMFRVLDTIEDAPFTDRDLQQRQFETLRGFLRKMPAMSDVKAFVRAFPADVTDGERALLEESHVLLAESYALPSAARTSVFFAMDRMALGMAAYTLRPTPMRLVDLEDVARYCCFVAGVVGEMLTQLWELDRKAPPPCAAHAYHFGMFLQKVNILKDQQEDELAGRFLVPHRPDLLASLHKDGDGALAYLLALPRNDPYRIFCAWSLMLGALTIAQLDEPKRSRRDEVSVLLTRIAAIAHDNAALAQQFAELMPRLPERIDGTPIAKPESFEWFRDTLAAPLSDAELRDLGVGSPRAVQRVVAAARPR